MKIVKLQIIFLVLFFQIQFQGNAQPVQAQNSIKINLADSIKVSPIKYGWHYEEIGMIGEGGLYAEMVRNRALEEANMPRGLTVEGDSYAGIPKAADNDMKRVYKVDPLIGWAKFPSNTGNINIERVDTNPLNEFNPHSLCVTVKTAGNTATGGVVNKGYYGMYFKKGDIYNLSFYARGEAFNGDVYVSLCTENGTKVSGAFTVSKPGSAWEKYTVSFEALATTDKGMLYFEPNAEGKFYLDIVSMLPNDTWDNGKSIFRADIMRNMIDYAPDFLRFPGGCIIHGVNVETMYHWKETIGDIAKRPGAWSKWGPNYRTDGLGYHEFYQLCEYLHCDAMYVAPSGLVCTGWVFKADEKDEHHHPNVDVQEYIQDALDAIEYAIGPADSKWGSKRAENGHPKPFPLKYVEFGNEDFGPTYYRNYDAFYKVVKAKYPQLVIIANSIIGQSKDADMKRERIAEFKNPKAIEIFDEHYYKTVPWILENYYKFDEYKRPGPDLFIGELGIQGNETGLLGEAIFMMNMERNADLKPMMADRPLMRNWDFVEGKMYPLLYHTNSQSFKTFNYYISKLFRDNLIDEYYCSAFYSSEKEQPLNENYLFSSVGKDNESNELVIKIVNISDEPISSKLQIGQLNTTVAAKVTTLVSQKGVRNTPERPNAVVPLVENIDLNLQNDYIFKPKSLTVIRVNHK